MLCKHPCKLVCALLGCGVLLQMFTWALGELVQTKHSRVPALIEVYPSMSGSCQCSEGEVRLVNGNFTCGRVEVCIGGAWCTVCDNNFDLADAQVVCQQLEAGPGKSRQEGNKYCKDSLCGLFFYLQLLLLWEMLPMGKEMPRLLSLTFHAMALN